jgi:hypothetical protein
LILEHLNVWRDLKNGVFDYWHCWYDGVSFI